ncbi:MAG: histidine kinase [Actinoplanes sp.]
MNAKHWAADLTVTLLLGAVLIAELAGKAPQPGEAATTWFAYGWAVLIVAPILVHRRFPVSAALITAVGIVGYAAGHFVAFPGYAAFAMVFLISLHTARGRGLFAFGAMGVALGVALSQQPSVTVNPSTWVISMLALAVAWLAGENLRIRQERWAAARDRARRLEEERDERDRRVVTAERLRIARELHDVVAHSMSVMAVQAGVAHHVLDSRPEVARQALATVETGARAALVEMRRLLGVLRQEDESPTSLVPAPTLADVAALVTQFRAAGLIVEVTGTGPPPTGTTAAAAEGPPEGVELSAYRIVQEGLTNVLRHGGPRAGVRIDHEPGQLRLTITDDGPTAAARGGIAAPGGSGHGLVGMRERVAVFGGAFSAGPLPGGGFAVSATLPYAEAVTVPGIPMAAGA